MSGIRSGYEYISGPGMGCCRCCSITSRIHRIEKRVSREGRSRPAAQHGSQQHDKLTKVYSGESDPAEGIRLWKFLRSCAGCAPFAIGKLGLEIVLRDGTGKYAGLHLPWRLCASNIEIVLNSPRSFSHDVRFPSCCNFWSTLGLGRPGQAVGQRLFDKI